MSSTASSDRSWLSFDEVRHDPERVYISDSILDATSRAFHDLFQPQRMANLRMRLDEFMLAGMEPRIILVTRRRSR